MELGSICNREVIVALKQETVADAITLIRNHHVGDLVIIEHRGSAVVPVGILTDREILISVVAEGLDTTDLLISDIMSHELVTARADCAIEEGLKLMRHRGIRRLPVVGDDGELVGILSVDDIIDLMAEEIADLAALIRQEQAREIRRTTHTGLATYG